MLVPKSITDLDTGLRKLFGSQAAVEGPMAKSGAGLRLAGIDLSGPLNPDQAAFLIDALSHFRILCVPGQNLARFSLAHLERFANHWGAPQPHPNNFMRGGKPAQSDGASDGPIELIPVAERTATAVSAAFPDQLQCLPHESPIVLVVSNFRGNPEHPGVRSTEPTRIAGGGSWHTDIEYEPIPLEVSMFLVHHMPTSRTAAGSWVDDPANAPLEAHPYFDGSPEALMNLRKRLPVNGETAFADTAAAFAALAPAQREALERIQLRRRLNEGDEGWLAPLVRTNPRSGIKSLHSPVWASRPRVRPPIEVDGLSPEDSRAFLDDIEAHVLQSEFRYDHAHEPGDVTLWDNLMTIHNSPPMKIHIDDVDDARLLYRVSCKGGPCLSLPRSDSPGWLSANITGAYSTPQAIIEV